MGRGAEVGGGRSVYVDFDTDERERDGDDWVDSANGDNVAAVVVWGDEYDVCNGVTRVGVPVVAIYKDTEGTGAEAVL